MKRVILELSKFKKELFLIIISTLGTTLATLGLPALLRGIIDEAIPNKDYAKLFTTTGLMVVFVVIGILAGIWGSKLSAQVSMGVGRNMRSEIFNKVQNFSQSEIDAFSTSSLITRTNNDITQIQTFLNQVLRIAIMAPIMCICGIALAVSTSPRLSAVLVISVPVMAIILVIIGKIAIPLSTSIQTKLDNINLVIREKLTGVRVVRAFGTQKFEADKFEKINTDYKKTSKKMQRVSNLLLPFMILILSMTIAIILYMAYNQSVYQGVKYTAGELMAIIEYILMILMAVVMMTLVFLLLPRATTSAKRAQEILSSVNEIDNAEEPKDNTEKQGYLEFKNVSFTYKGADVPAIQGLSFSAKPGETTAIIGGTGMGKTTIVNLIPRLYDVTEGQVLVDGIDVRDYDLSVLRKKIGFVPQKAVLFKGTIESNLRFGDDDPTEERIEKAVEIAQSTEFVMKKEDGYESVVAQGGSNFSGGQKQRLCIARAVVRKPEIYVFDDSFSALDFKTDKNLRAALAEETDNATVVIVAQRVSTIMEADRIIVVEQGKIAGIGTHHELLKTCDVYKEIVASQMSEEEMNK
ncbi:MAG: ABC transporter ATP-binding protein [Oscillospiraceae bacterium]|nr:ABC transporter ATP-binding protein [Candidatus Ruminococcus equi]